jgi:hypothetical protein
MNFDEQIRRYFGIADLAAVPPEALNAGVERMKVDLGLTKDHGERFALWALLHVLGSAPDLDVVFQTQIVRRRGISWISFGPLPVTSLTLDAPRGRPESAP